MGSMMSKKVTSEKKGSSSEDLLWVGMEVILKFVGSTRVTPTSLRNDGRLPTHALPSPSFLNLDNAQDNACEGCLKWKGVSGKV